MFNKYYQDELEFLRHLGAEFGRAYPSAASSLTDRSADPDVERLMEGFAFIAGQVRQKLDDELPELTHSLLSLLWPHYLRPIPSTTILEFAPRADVRGKQSIPRGVEAYSAPIEDTVCRFRTCYDVELRPLAVENVVFEKPLAGSSLLRLRFRILNGAQLKDQGFGSLRLFLYGDPHITYDLYLRLMTQVLSIRIQTTASGRPKDGFALPPSAPKPVGFDRDCALLPYPDHCFSGYRLLQEYFTLPEKYLFVDICDLESLMGYETPDEAFEIIIEYKPSLQEAIRLSAGNIRLHCAPAVNLFTHSADPLVVDHTRTEYRIRPACDRIEHYEIFSVDRISGIELGSGRRIDYSPFYAFTHAQKDQEKRYGYYQTRIKDSPRPREEDEEIEVYRVVNLRDSTVGYGTDWYVSFVSLDAQAAVPAVETVSTDLTCSNRHLPEQLNVGDVREMSPTSPKFASFQNIVKPTSSVSPPLDGGIHWRLISHLSLNYLSLLSLDALRGILELYNFQAYSNQQAARANELRTAGMLSIESRPSEWILRGAPIRGRAVKMTMDEDNFAGEGDMYLFANILNEFIALYATLNSFTQFTVRGTRRGEEYKWPRRMGSQIVL